MSRSRGNEDRREWAATADVLWTLCVIGDAAAAVGALDMKSVPWATDMVSVQKSRCPDKRKP